MKITEEQIQEESSILDRYNAARQRYQAAL